MEKIRQALQAEYDAAKAMESELLSKIEGCGFVVDMVKLNSLDIRLTVELAAMIKQLCEFGIEIWGSKQVIEAFKKLHVFVKATNQQVMARIAEKGGKVKELAELVTRFQKARHLQGQVKTVREATITDAQGPWAGVPLLHYRFTTECSSGRIYAKEPNVMNLAVEIRNCLKPVRHAKFLLVDVVSEELIIAAVLAGDRDVIDAYNSGKDLHQDRADKLGVSREIGKLANLAIMYGADPEYFAKKHGIDPTNLALTATLRGPVQKFREKIQDQVREQGFVKTLFGNRLVCQLTGEEFNDGYVFRLAFNHVIQGTAAELLRIMMYRMREFRVAALAQDALLIEVPGYAGVGPDVLKSLEGFKFGDAILRFKSHVGDSYGEAMD